MQSLFVERSRDKKKGKKAAQGLASRNHHVRFSGVRVRARLDGKTAPKLCYAYPTAESLVLDSIGSRVFPAVAYAFIPTRFSLTEFFFCLLIKIDTRSIKFSVKFKNQYRIDHSCKHEFHPLMLLIMNKIPLHRDRFTNNTQ